MASTSNIKEQLSHGKTLLIHSGGKMEKQSTIKKSKLTW